MLRVLVMGAGGVGGYFGSLLHKGGQEVTMVARGEHLEAMRREGLKVLSHKGNFTAYPEVTDDPSDLGHFDLILFTVKSYDTEAGIQLIEGNVGPDTVILSLQNGVENDEKLAEAFGREKLVGGVAYIGAGVLEPGVIEHRSVGRMSIGDYQTEKSAQLAETFREAGIECSVSEDIMKEKWEKLVFNAAFNSVTTLTRSTFGDVVACEGALSVARSIMEEVVAVAQREGLDLSEASVQRATDLAESLGDAHSSMMNDLLSGKKLEVDALLGPIVRKGAQHGVATPVSEAVFRMIEQLERGGNAE